MKTRNWRIMKMEKQTQFHWEMRLVWLSLMKLLQVHAITSPSYLFSLCHGTHNISVEVLFSKHYPVMSGKAITLVTHPILMHCFSFWLWECDKLSADFICQLAQCSYHPFTTTIAVLGPTSHCASTLTGRPWHDCCLPPKSFNVSLPTAN